MTFRVIIGPAAIHVGRYWVGVASGNYYAKQRRRTWQAAMADARKLERRP